MVIGLHPRWFDTQIFRKFQLPPQTPEKRKDSVSKKFRSRELLKNCKKINIFD